jgi:hypothetical protein
VGIGVVHGFLVYMALVLDSNNNFHGVLVDAGNGKDAKWYGMTGPGMIGPGMGMTWYYERSWNQ